MLVYDWKKPLNQREKDGRFIVRIIRKHCEKEHPHTRLWNTVSETKTSVAERIEPVDHLVHQALRAGGSTGVIPSECTSFEFQNGFVMRMANAFSWLRWSRMTVKRLNALGEPSSLLKVARSRLDDVLQNCLAKIKSEGFQDTLGTFSLEQMFNELMLFFYEFGRYKSSPIFQTSD